MDVLTNREKHQAKYNIKHYKKGWKNISLLQRLGTYQGWRTIRARASGPWNLEKRHMQKVSPHVARRTCRCMWPMGNNNIDMKIVTHDVRWRRGERVEGLDEVKGET